MNETITFEDVNIVPRFSNIPSRSSIDLSMNLPGLPYVSLPIISANMDTVTEAAMAKAMISYGGTACLHRFQSIEDNVKMFQESGSGDFSESPMVAIGLGDKEIERAEALRDAGAKTFVIDVNHGANIEVVKQAKLLRDVLGKYYGIVVGNFATGKTVSDFLEYEGSIDAFKIGIGGGSSCLTRVKTGIGVPQLSALLDCRGVLKKAGITMIADGGMKSAGDIAKALASGANIVMTGGMLAGTEETPGEIVYFNQFGEKTTKDELFAKRMLREGGWEYVIHSKEESYWSIKKKYRGSASHESYIKQGKVDKHRAIEGESFMVPYKGTVSEVLQDIEGGLRGSFSMVGAWNIKEFHEKAEFIRISQSSTVEAGAHGKNQ